MSEAFLLVSVRSCVCAVPLAAVDETMPALPLVPAPGAPAFVQGVSVIRGAPVPVVDLGAIIGAEAEPTGRLVSLRLGDGRRVALRVGALLGVRRLGFAEIDACPPLLGDAHGQAVSALGRLDGQLVLVLDTFRIVDVAGSGGCDG